MNSLTKVSLKRFFQRYSAARLRLPAAKGNVYELFVSLNACAAAQRAGLAVSLWAPGGTYIVRASPGALGGIFGHAALTSSRGATYELHNGIEIDGQSAMFHEADLLLVNAPGSAQGGPPRAALGGRDLLWTAECKLYGSANRLKGEARKTVGAVVDWSQSAHQVEQELSDAGVPSLRHGLSGVLRDQRSARISTGHRRLSQRVRNCPLL